MVDIWKYASLLPRVKIITTDGQQFSGKVIEVSDAEEDDNETEDSIVLDLDDGRIMGFYPSEIQSIE